jgi:UDP-2,4-diacetamido-2,4,6-trideoxy-beta-L-altropyranose hydrolase
MGLSGSVVTFRTDASLQIGTGHVMRCLTLADSLRKRGAVCHFISRPQPGDLIEFVRRKGHGVHPLPQKDETPEDTDPIPALAHAAWLRTDQISDALETRDIVDQLNPDWLIVDHYALDARWEGILRDHSRKLLVIDDLADRKHDCDLLLDYNLGCDPESYDGLVPPGCKKLIGVDFALLRPEFAEWREASLQRRKEPRLRSLLISMGGIDKDNGTATVLTALQGCRIPPDCRMIIVIGAGCPWLSQIRQQASTLPWNTTILNNTDEMAKIMSQSDLAIGAGGVTGLERACLGLPSIMLETADNQRPFLAAFEREGFAVTAPGFQYLTKNEKLVTIRRLFQRVLNSENTSKVIGSACDGLGSERVAQTLAGM